MEKIANFASHWSKLTNGNAILQIVKRPKIPFLERPYQKQTMVKITVSGGKEVSRNRSLIIVEERSYSTCSEFKGSVCQQHFSETKKRRLFPPNYEFKKFKLVHSIFIYQNGKSETSKIFITTKRSNGKIRFARPLLQRTRPSRNTKICEISMESESIPGPIYLFLPETWSEDLHETSKDFYVNSKENEHSIKILSRGFRQLQSIDSL